MGEEVGRCVERRDGQCHSGGRPVGEGGVADAGVPAGHGQGLAVDAAGLGRADRERGGHPFDLGAAVLDGFAQFKGEKAGEPVAVGERVA